MKKALLVALVLMAIVAGFILSLIPGAARAWRSDSIIKSYFAHHKIRKVQLGAGTIRMSDWLNTDIEPSSDEAYLDATQPFPFPDNSVNYIFGEHVIEHLSYAGGLVALRESHRVLVPGGKIRLATPDLRRFTALLDQAPREYLNAKFAFHGWGSVPPAIAPVWIINMELRRWGHQFVYDEPSLRDSLTRSGFVEVKRFKPGESDDSNLTSVESRHNTLSIRPMNDYESMVLQATKAAVPGK